MAGIMEKMYGNQGGGSGGDSHNKGSFLTPAALREAYPTAEPGDFAIVESTDTIWVWDNDGSDWKDADQKGQVTSVNNQTGAVTVQETLVNQTNIKSVNGNSLLGSGDLELTSSLAFPAGWTTNSTTKALCDSVAADTSAVAGKMYLGEVTCSDLPASIANSEVKVEIVDGTTAQNKVILLELTSGNVAPYRWQYTYWNGGSNVSGWQTWLQNTATGGYGALTILGAPAGNTMMNIGYNSGASGAGYRAMAVGINAHASTNSDDQGSTALGYGASASKGGLAVGMFAETTEKTGLAIGHEAQSYADYAIQLNAGRSQVANNDANTFKVANNNGNYEIMSANGTIPTDRFTTTPVADGTYIPTLTISSGTATRTWGAPASGLPSQSGQSGKFLTTDGTDASWAAPTVATFRVWGANE